MLQLTYSRSMVYEIILDRQQTNSVSSDPKRKDFNPVPAHMIRPEKQILIRYRSKAALSPSEDGQAADAITAEIIWSF
jgi:hypothetical protein